MTVENVFNNEDLIKEKKMSKKYFPAYRQSGFGDTYPWTHMQTLKNKNVSRYNNGNNFEYFSSREEAQKAMEETWKNGYTGYEFAILEVVSLGGPVVVPFKWTDQ